MNIANGFRRFHAAIRHWGPTQYLLLGALWLALSIPLYLVGWGYASIFGLPLFLLSAAALTWLVSALFRLAPPSRARPRKGLPSELVHPALGPFPLASNSDCRYSRSVAWCGGTVELLLEVQDAGAIDEVLRAAGVLVERAAQADRQAASFAARRALPSINEERRAANMPSLTEEQFLQTIALKHVFLWPNGEYSFIYDDGDLLGGHWLDVHGSLQSGPAELTTPG